MSQREVKRELFDRPVNAVLRGNGMLSGLIPRSAVITDFSPNGAGIVAARRSKVGQKVLLSFRYKTVKITRLPGEIRHISPAGEGWYRCGIHFDFSQMSAPEKSTALGLLKKIYKALQNNS